ncbi:hypothetical protein Ancab_026165 [Ancistrocladus abbreviatus]
MRAAPESSGPSQNGNANSDTNISRPLAKFRPSLWADTFVNFTSSDEVAQAQMEQQVKELIEEVKKELLPNANGRVIEITIIDLLERLGVAYHFEQEIEEALQDMYENCVTYNDTDDLYRTSIRFRILRQHGFHVSSGMHS